MLGLHLHQLMTNSVELHEFLLRYRLATVVFEQVLPRKGEPRILQFSVYDRPQLVIEGAGVHLHEHVRKQFNSLRTRIQAGPEHVEFLPRCGAQPAGLAIFTIVARRILIDAAWFTMRQRPQTNRITNQCPVPSSETLFSRACSALAVQLYIALMSSMNAQRLKYNRA